MSRRHRHRQKTKADGALLSWGDDVQICKGGTQVRISIGLGGSKMIERVPSVDVSFLAIDELTRILLSFVGDKPSGTLSDTSSDTLPPFPAHVFRSSCFVWGLAAVDLYGCRPADVMCRTCIGLEIPCEMEEAFRCLYDWIRPLLLAARRCDPLPEMENLRMPNAVLVILGVLAWRRIWRTFSDRFCPLD